MSVGGRDEGPRPIGESMPRVLARMGVPPTPALMDVVFSRWEEMVGTELGRHVRPVRVDGRVLVVSADHPAWATRIRMESGQILARVRAGGETAVERLEVVVDRT